MAGNKVLKEYDVLRESITSCSRWTLSQNGEIIFCSDSITKWKGIHLHLRSADGTTILGTCKPKSTFGKTMLLFIGDPDRERFELASSELKCETFSQSKYSFTHLSRPYTWTRTHDKDIGGHRWGSKDYKLVDQTSGEVLAAWSNNNAMFSRNPEGKILFFKEMETELEILSLVAICRIEVFLRQQTAAAAVAASA